VAAVRRLSAIMFTDTVGSTAMAQANESATLRLSDEQEELIRPLFAAHQGREIKSLGDGVLCRIVSSSCRTRSIYLASPPALR
jgi:class 3 adenylate cyclase